MKHLYTFYLHKLYMKHFIYTHTIMNLLSLLPAIHAYNLGVLEADIIHTRIGFFPASPLDLSNAAASCHPGYAHLQNLSLDIYNEA